MSPSKRIELLKMSTLDKIYYITIVINFIVSIAFRRLWKRFFWLYFVVTILVETLVSCRINFITTRIYNYLDIFCIAYFGWIYFEELKQNKIKIASIFFILAGLVFIYISKTNYSIETGFLYSIFLIFISLYWFFQKILEKNSEVNIIYVRYFWISSSLLLWAVFYIFRMFPMYFFAMSDLEFANILKVTFQIVTIISYIIFLKGLLTEK